MKIKDIFT